MATKCLVNTTRAGTVTHVAGSLYDTVLSAWEIPSIEEAGGKLVEATAEILAAAALARKLHDQGAAFDLLDTIMLAQAQRAGTTDYNDSLVYPPLGATTIQGAIDIIKTTTVASGVLISVSMPSMTDGDFGYASANNVLSKTDAASVTTARFVAANVGISGQALVNGLVQNAKFSAICATPIVGDCVFLARADDEGGGGAAGKLTSTPPSTGVVAEIGNILAVDPLLFPATRVASVVLSPKAILVRS